MIDVLNSLGESGLDLHSSIVLTYSFDLVLYDGLIRRRLRQAGVVNQIVLCDFRKYQEQLDSVSAARQFGRSYSVTPVPQAAAFHPKLYMVLGRKGGRLVIGSGNATIGGMLRNAETFGLFEYERGRSAGPHPAFRQCFEFIEQICERASDVVKKQLARVRSWTPWLEAQASSDHRTVLIGGPGRKSLLDQIRETIGRESIREILVCTSSVDRRLTALRELAALTKRSKVRCIVQPEQLQIDGHAVRRLGKTIQWQPFVDPHPRGKKKRRDVYAHAKLLAFNCGDREVLVYGSANASNQAFLETPSNTEIVVIFAPWRNGTTVKRLALSASLKAKDIAKELSQRVWGEEREDKAIPYAVLLTSAVPMANGISVNVAGGIVPDGTSLELFETPGRRAMLSGKVVSVADGLLVRLRNVPENLRIAQLKAVTGEPLSNPVGLTWPGVASVQSSSGINARSEAAILAMQDGTLLGTVLFELLDQYRDFEVVRGRGSRKSESVNQHEANIDRPVESFYTDAVPGDIAPTAWIGDRTDLDLLAALVQPLQTGIQKVKERIDEDEVIDSVLEEEGERREIDAKGGRATGQEKIESPSLTSTETVKKASRRLQRRLDRASTAVERALAQRRELTNIPAAGLARQIWMAHIAAFLTGREAPTSDGDMVLCLDRRHFAEYILRVCRALAGGKDGGLLHLVPKDTFAGPDGDSLKAGLSFLWTCLIFAVAEVTALWVNSPINVHDEDEEIEYACDVWDAIPELVAARFVLAVRPYCQKPDLLNISRRLPACDSVEGWFDEWKLRIEHLADFIERIERAKDIPVESIQVKSPFKAGNLVLNDALGVTALAAMGDNRKCYLVDFSRSDEENPNNALRVFFAERVKRLVLPSIVREPVWRSPEWLISESD